jgi:hypothetical protein
MKALILVSTAAGDRGSPETWRDPRGFALKFYTHKRQEGFFAAGKRSGIAGQCRPLIFAMGVFREKLGVKG